MPTIYTATRGSGAIDVLARCALAMRGQPPPLVRSTRATGSAHQRGRAD